MLAVLWARKPHEEIKTHHEQFKCGAWRIVGGETITMTVLL